MAKSFSLDMSALVKALQDSPEAAGKGAKQAMDDIKDDWVRGARDVAPLDSGNLRKQISGEVEGGGLESEVIVTANAVNQTGNKRFNYGYYIHEGHMAKDGKQLRTPGTVEQFLDDTGEKNEAKWQGWLEDEIGDALKRKGW